MSGAKYIIPLCQVAISVATGMSEGVVDDVDGTVVARFRIES